MAGTGGRSWKRILLWAIGIAVVLFIVIQFIPYGRSSHSNPTATNPFQWADPQAEAIARESCYDCHSNETEWWWATNIAPFSWLVQRDVDEGRAAMNFSEFDGAPSAEEFAGGRERRRDASVPVHDHPPGREAHRRREADARRRVRGRSRGEWRLERGLTRAGAVRHRHARTDGHDGDAVAIIDQRCGSCHPTDRALAFRAGSEAEAQALIDNMVQRGAQVTPEEQQVLVQYFTQ